MAYLIIAVGDKKKKLELTADFLFIGQDPDNQIRLNDPKVSKKHCQILKTDEGFRILDLGSESGTLVNNEKITQVDLEEGDIIQVGGVKMAIKDLAPAVQAPVSGAGKKTAAGRRRKQKILDPGASTVSRRKTKKRREPLEIKKEYAAASESGRERLVRKQLRKGSKIPGWAQAVFGFWALAILVLIGVWVVKQAKPSPYEETFLKAQNYIQQNQPYLAMKTLEKIPRDDYHWGEMAYEELTRLQLEQERGEIAQYSKRAMENFANNIELFIHKYIDAPEEKPKWARKIKRDYAPDRESYVRTLLVRRIPYYLENFPEGKDKDKVLAFKRKYSKEVDLNKPPTYRDIELEADTELNLNHWGNAYQLIDGWRKTASSSERKEFQHRIDGMMDKIWGQLQKEWRLGRGKTDVERREADGNYLGANKIYHRMLSLAEGYDAPEAKEIRAYWQKKFDENEAAIEAMTGVEKRTTGEE